MTQIPSHAPAAVTKSMAAWHDMVARRDLARMLQPAAYLLAPVLIYQGGRLRRTIPRLPEAADPDGTAGGRAPAIRLAVFGDSTAAGVAPAATMTSCAPAAAHCVPAAYRVRSAHRARS